MKKPLFLLISVLIFYLSLFPSCNNKEKVNLDGVWRAELYLQEDTLPFNFELKNDSSITIKLLNAEEEILIDEIKIKGDSIYADLHIFDSKLKAKIENGILHGTFEKNYSKGYILPFKAEKGKSYRFNPGNNTEINIAGRWEVMFESNEEDSVFSIAEFKQEGNKVTGTFLTETGDYRFLEGSIIENSLKLSCFDGEHAFLFKADYSNGELQGIFKSGKTWNETWNAKRNDTITLTNAYELTYLKSGFDSIYFTFRNLVGDSISFPNPEYEGKAVLIQIFGTWCPNCMDETIFLNNWYQNQDTSEIKILALAYERKNDLKYARERILKMKNRLNIGYDFLFAGSSDKSYASESLPMLNQIISFPTLIFLDKNHQVKAIHTGFSGPGTGEYFEKFKLEFEKQIESL